MKYKIYSDGTVVNCIEATEDFCAAYCAEMGYTYEADPLPVPVITSEPTPDKDAAAFFVDHEYRITLLELGVI